MPTITNMASWHQQRASKGIRYFHETLWTVLIDPPGQPASSIRFKTKEEAETYAKNIRYAIVLKPSKE